MRASARRGHPASPRRCRARRRRRRQTQLAAASADSRSRRQPGARRRCRVRGGERQERGAVVGTQRARPSWAGAGPQRARPSLAGVAAGHVTACVCMHAGRCVRALLSCAGVRPVGPRSRSWRRSPGAEAAGARGSCRTSTGLAELGRSRASTGPVELGRSRHRRCCGIRACTRADACAHDCGF
jgi:hypothetical protein